MEACRKGEGAGNGEMIVMLLAHEKVNKGVGEPSPLKLQPWTGTKGELFSVPGGMK
jgi:hypothetical protein